MNAPFHLAGETAAVATAALWAMSALAWHLAGRRIGSVAVTTIRIAAATIVLATIHQLAFGSPWPTRMPIHAQKLLALSGILGAGIGDLMLFRSFQLIGPRLGMLMLSFSPILATLLAGCIPPRENLGIQAILGIVLTAAGVAWTVSEPTTHHTITPDRRLFRHGVLLALASATCIGVSFLLTRRGLLAAGDGQAFSGTLVRVAAATVLCVAALPLLGRVRTVVDAVRDRKAMLIVAGGVVVGPVIGIWLSLVGFQYAPTGVTSALIGLSPIFMLPISRAVYGERPTMRAVIGTLLAVAGSATLFLRATP
ncbi:MAG: DMT family transporter [bacterium]